MTMPAALRAAPGRFSHRHSGTSLGELEQWPRMKIGLMAHDTVRVEPYKTPLKVIAHE